MDGNLANNPLMNLWKYFHPGCYSGFDDGQDLSFLSPHPPLFSDHPQSFYHIYGKVFHEIHIIDLKEQSTITDIIQFGNSLTSASEVRHLLFTSPSLTLSLAVTASTPL
jgi:hypothetical protein